jgi:peptide/nickel transport system permease protein
VTVDFPAIMAITAIVATVFVLVNFLVDLSYAMLDPRVLKR